MRSNFVQGWWWTSTKDVILMRSTAWVRRIVESREDLEFFGGTSTVLGRKLTTIEENWQYLRKSYNILRKMNNIRGNLTIFEEKWNFLEENYSCQRKTLINKGKLRFRNVGSVLNNNNSRTAGRWSCYLQRVNQYVRSPSLSRGRHKSHACSYKRTQTHTLPQKMHIIALLYAVTWCTFQ